MNKEKKIRDKHGNYKKLIDLLTKEEELTIDEIQNELNVSQPTAYRYIKDLSEQDEIFYDSEEKKYKLTDKNKTRFDDTLYLDYILTNTIHKIKIHRIPNLPNSSKNDSDESINTPYIKTIIIEFNCREYEQRIANLLYDKFIDEITLITVGVGGLIVYLNRNKKSKLFSYLKEIHSK